jgi:NMD protein affecting ribosome stability and mRNA decay
MKIKTKKNAEMERCVSCGKPTNYSKNTNIEYRLYYIEGAGQLCSDCYNIIYNKKIKT